MNLKKENDNEHNSEEKNEDTKHVEGLTSFEVVNGVGLDFLVGGKDGVPSEQD